VYLPQSFFPETENKSVTDRLAMRRPRQPFLQSVTTVLSNVNETLGHDGHFHRSNAERLQVAARSDGGKPRTKKGAVSGASAASFFNSMNRPDQSVGEEYWQEQLLPGVFAESPGDSPRLYSFCPEASIITESFYNVRISNRIEESAVGA